MSSWIIEPREPLIVRDGRPFDPQPGVVATSLPFPFPSTIAGAVRTRAGSENGVFTTREEDLPELLELQIRGPLLVELLGDGQERLLVPAPGDALLLEGDEPLRCKPCVPLKPFPGAHLPSIQGPNGTQLAPVGQEEYEAEKPAKNPPAFWYWDRFTEWLGNPAGINEGLSRQSLGIPALPQEEQRVHVSLEPGTNVAREGALFATRGLEFTAQPFPPGKASLSQARRLALWLDVEGQKGDNIEQELASLGGERRLVRWQKSRLNLENLSEPLDQLSAQIAEIGACRLLLLTPAYFQRGYLPDAESWEHEGVRPELHAALVQRPQVVSGWNLAKPGAKPTRRLAPAGSVFFLKFPTTADRQAIECWVRHFWMRCISDDRQACLDGFGLAVLGTWDGGTKEMRIKGE